MRLGRESRQEDGNLPFGERLRRERLLAGLTQEELAERATLSVRGVRALEQGERQRPHAHTVRRLAEALGLDGEARECFEQGAQPSAKRYQIGTNLPAEAQGDAATGEARHDRATHYSGTAHVQEALEHLSRPADEPLAAMLLDVLARLRRASQGPVSTPQSGTSQTLPGLERDVMKAALHLVPTLAVATSFGLLIMVVILAAVTGSFVFLLLAWLAFMLVIAVVGFTWCVARLIAAWRDRLLIPIAQACNVRARTLPRSDSLLSGDMGRLFQVCAKDPTPAGARDAALFAVLFGGGLSISRAVILDMSDYDRESGALVVRPPKRQGGPSHLGNGARNAVEDWIAIRGDEPGPLFLPTDPAGQIESHPATGACHRTTTRAAREALRKRAIEAHAAPFTRPPATRDFVPLPDSVIATFFAGRPPRPIPDLGSPR